MALARINLVLQEDDGDIVDGASIEVRNEATLALAPVFSDRAGTVSLGNPFTAADGGDAGFYVAGGAYKITATLSGFSKTIRYQAAGTLAESDSGGSQTINVLTLTGGQIVFPATANPSSNANTLDDYEEGTWTPLLQWFTANSIVLTVGVKNAIYTKIGRTVSVGCQFLNYTVTYTTGSNGLIIAGLPFQVRAEGEGYSPIGMQGVTKASYTQFYFDAVGAEVYINIGCVGSGQTISNILTTNLPSGTTSFYMYGACTYHAAS